MELGDLIKLGRLEYKVLEYNGKNICEILDLDKTQNKIDEDAECRVCFSKDLEGIN